MKKIVRLGRTLIKKYSTRVKSQLKKDVFFLSFSLPLLTRAKSFLIAPIKNIISSNESNNLYYATYRERSFYWFR
jgi:hypothetical protein